MKSSRFKIAAGAGVLALAAGAALAAAPANAAALPSCATAYHCTTNVAGELGGILENGGTAGYYGADDNHTHYRYVQTTVTATPQLVDLNGPVSSALYQGSVGDSLCDPNSGIFAQISLGYVAGTGYEVAYAVGRYDPVTGDPCIQNNFQNDGFVGEGIFKSGELLQNLGISAGNQVFLGIYYTPAGNHRHQLSFGACNVTTGVCRQAYTSQRALEFWEFGVGAYTPTSVLTGGAVNKFETFSSSDVTCYACSGAVPISSVTPVNSFGAGGLYENQTDNSSSETVMGPDDTLSGDTFDMFNGSTSI